MSKRSSTSDISDESQTIFSSVSSPLSSNDTQASIETGNTPSLHYIRQTFLGPICAKCNTKISSLGMLFTISRQTIIRHWKANNCYIGDIKQLNAKEVENNLRMSIVQLYNTIRNNPTLASKHVRAHFHCKTTSQSPYCSRCGYVGKAENVRRHINSDACNCTSNEAKISEGKVLMDKYNFSIPQQVLDTISSGMFELPFDQFTNTIITVQKSNDAETNSSTSSHNHHLRWFSPTQCSCHLQNLFHRMRKLRTFAPPTLSMMMPLPLIHLQWRSCSTALAMKTMPKWLVII
jgi:hypothetical protein